MEQMLSPFQYSLIFNAFSFTLATMAATTLFLWLNRGQVSDRYKGAVTISGLVCAIAAYHYFRIGESWEAAYTLENGVLVATGYAFNDAYRYVDWLLTVPLLLIEIVLIMGLSRDETISKSVKLGAAAALMVALGYPGEISDDNTTRAIWGALSTIPFLYVVYELFSGLSEAIERQHEGVRDLIKKARLLTFASWGFYPIVYMAPFADIAGPTAETIIQVGYTLADLLAKAVVGVLIYMIAVRKTAIEAGLDADGKPLGAVAV
jgi:bacteriorhodopsin